MDKTTATFRHDANGVRCETGARVSIKKGATYEVIEHTQRRAGSVTLTLVDPKETYLGGGDGKTRLPCTIRTQVPEKDVSLATKDKR